MSRRAATATSRIARQVSRLDHDHLPAPVRALARQCVLDLLGVAVAGAASTAPSVVADAVAGGAVAGVPRPATVVGRGRVAGVGGAALANGVAAHVLDYDDVLPVMTGHPSAPVVPAALAVAEDLGSHGRELVTAVVAGIETEARVGASVTPAHYERGFHTTGTAGAVGAAAACARLHRLDPARTEMALGLAVAQASGLKCMFGSMAKSLQAGHAAAAGVLAAQLAASGFTSCRDALGAEQGFGSTYAGGADPDVLGAPFGRPWYILDTLFKVHAACYYAHATIEAMLSARASVDHRTVTAVELAVHPVQTTACSIADPSTPIEAKFSLQFVSALALARGRAGEPDFSGSSLADPAVARLRRLVTVTADPALGQLACRAVVRASGGRTLTVERDGDRRGWQEDPREQDGRLVGKFTSLARPVLGPARAARVLEVVAGLGDDGDVRALMALLSPPPGANPARDGVVPTATSRTTGGDRVGAQ